MTNRKLFLMIVSILFLSGLVVGMVSLSHPVKAASNLTGNEVDSLWSSRGYPLVSVSEELQSDPRPIELSVSCTPDISGIIAYWPLNDALNTATPGVYEFEELIADYVGTCTDPTCPSLFTDGKVGDAFLFNASETDKLSVPSSAYFDRTNTDSFSFEAWIKTTQVCSQNKVFFGRYMNLGPTWWLGCSGAGHATFHMRDSTLPTPVVRQVIGTSLINDGNWHHIVGVRDGVADENRLYVDGVQQGMIAAPAFTGNFASTGAITMGFYDNKYYYDGVLDEVGIYGIALTVDDIAARYKSGDGQSACTTEPPNAGNVSFSTTEDTSADVSESQLMANSSDPEAGTINFVSVDTTSAAGGTIASLGGGDYRYTPAQDFFGDDTFTFRVIDDQGWTDSGTATVSVSAVNDPPVLDNPGAQTNDEGDLVNLTITYTDPEGGVTFTAINLPTGLSIDPSTGVISGTIAYTAAGSYNVQVTGKDSENVEDTVTFNWTVSNVNLPPVLTPVPDQANVEGAVINLQVEATDNIDDDADTLAYSASGLPTGLSISPTTGLISGTISVGAAAGSPYTVEVSVTDSVNSAVSDTFTWTVTAPAENNPPEVTNPGDQVSYLGATISLQIEATDPDGDTLSYSAVGLPPGLTINPTTGLISGKLSKTITGIYQVTITVSDSIDQTEVEFQWTVSEVSMYNNYLPLILKPGGG